MKEVKDYSVSVAGGINRDKANPREQARTRPVAMTDRERFKLRFGPYEPPRTDFGRWLKCQMRGKVKVGTFSAGPIPWPRRWRTNGLILCGDLVRAVKKEAVQAVAWHWGVSKATVRVWRRALGVPEFTVGTLELNKLYFPHRQRAKMSVMLTLARRPPRRKRVDQTSSLSTEFRRRQVKERIKREGAINPWGRLWTPHEDRLLGTDTDAAIAARVGRTRTAVASRRSALGLPPVPKRKPWHPEEIQLVGLLDDAEVSRQTGHSLKSVEAKRLELGKPKLHSKIRPWTDRELRWLGKIPDAEVARRTGRTVRAVQGRRKKEGLLRRHVKKWKAEELALLGMASDAQIARQLGRTVTCVAVARRTRKIANYRPVPVQRPWTPEEDSLLDALPDEEIAQRLSRGIGSVKSRRLKLGLPKVDLQVRPWTETEVKLFGQWSDSEIAERTARSIIGVQIKRRKLKMAPVRSRRQPDWKPEEDRMLGKAPDPEIARRLGRTARAVTSRRTRLKIPSGYFRRWRPEEDRLLGGEFDAILAREFGRTKGAVAARRRKLGFAPPRNSHGHSFGRKWTPDEERMLGTEPDSTVAEKLGRSLVAVTERRHKLKIPNRWRQNQLWNAEDDKLLGKMSDEVLAGRLGRTVIAVKARRSIMGIGSSFHPVCIHWKPEELRLLGTKPDREVAREIGRTLESVRLKRLKMRITGFERPTQQRRNHS